MTTIQKSITTLQPNKKVAMHITENAPDWSGQTKQAVGGRYLLASYVSPHSLRFESSVATPLSNQNKIHNMKIEISIPTLDRLCDILEKVPQQTLLQFAAPLMAAQEEAPAQAKAEKPKVEKPKPAAKAAPVVVETPPEVEAPIEEPVEKPTNITVEELTELAQQVIQLNDIPTLRKLLDDAGIKGQKISTCDKKYYPAIKKAMEATLSA